MTAYAKCPNGCTGEVPLVVEGYGRYDDPFVIGVNDDENATSHDDGCPPLTEAQIDRIAEEFDVHDYLSAQAEASATGYL